VTTGWCGLEELGDRSYDCMHCEQLCWLGWQVFRSRAFVDQTMRVLTSNVCNHAGERVPQVWVCLSAAISIGSKFLKEKKLFHAHQLPVTF